MPVSLPTPDEAKRPIGLIELSLGLALVNTHVTILIVDEKVSLVMEIRDDSKGTFDEAIGLSSNSRAGVLSYISIFENLWLQTELYDQISESSFRLQEAN